MMSRVMMQVWVRRRKGNQRVIVREIVRGVWIFQRGIMVQSVALWVRDWVDRVRGLRSMEIGDVMVLLRLV
jgi:hypothetical protein